MRKWRLREWSAAVKQSFCALVWGTSSSFDRPWQSSKSAKSTKPSHTCSVVTVNPKAQSPGGAVSERAWLYIRAQFVADVLQSAKVETDFYNEVWKWMHTMTLTWVWSRAVWATSWQIGAHPLEWYQESHHNKCRCHHGLGSCDNSSCCILLAG